MSDLQTKLGGGINKLQDSLQQGKQKLQVAQEVSQIKKQLQTRLDERGTKIFKLGEELYKKIRNQEIHDDTLIESSNAIFQLDQEIYLLQEQLEEKNRTANNNESCPNCQAPVGVNDRFCGGCGSPVAVAQKVHEETAACPVCDVQVPVSANYCGCCGNKTS